MASMRCCGSTISVTRPCCWSIDLYLFSYITTALLGLLLAPKGIGHYWKTHYTDKIYNFHGLYRWNAFDTAMLIPYFVVMIILAFYGIHRYQLVWLYFKNKKNAAKWDATMAPKNCNASGFVGGGWWIKLRKPFNPKTVNIRPSK